MAGRGRAQCPPAPWQGVGRGARGARPRSSEGSLGRFEPSWLRALLGIDLSEAVLEDPLAFCTSCKLATSLPATAVWRSLRPSTAVVRAERAPPARSSAWRLLGGRERAAFMTSAAAFPAIEQSSPACCCTVSECWNVEKAARCVARSALNTAAFARSVHATCDSRSRSLAAAFSCAMRRLKSASANSCEEMSATAARTHTRVSNSRARAPLLVCRVRGRRGRHA